MVATLRLLRARGQEDYNFRNDGWRGRRPDGCSAHSVAEGGKGEKKGTKASPPKKASIGKKGRQHSNDTS